MGNGKSSNVSIGNSAQILGFNLPGIQTSGFYSPQALNVSDANMPAFGGATFLYLQDDAWGGVATDHVLNFGH